MTEQDFDAAVAKSAHADPASTDPVQAVLIARKRVRDMFIPERTDRVNYPLLEASVNPNTQITLRIGSVSAISEGRYYGGGAGTHGRVFRVHLKPVGTSATQVPIQSSGDATLSASTVTPITVNYDLVRMNVPRSPSAHSKYAVVRIPLGGLDGQETAIALNLPVCRLRLDLRIGEGGKYTLAAASVEWQTMSEAYGADFLRRVGTVVPAGRLGMHGVSPTGKVTAVDQQLLPKAVGAGLAKFAVTNLMTGGINRHYHEAAYVFDNKKLAADVNGIGLLARPFIHMAAMMDVHSYHEKNETGFGGDAWLFNPKALEMYMRATMDASYVETFMALYSAGAPPSLAQLLSGFSGLPMTRPQMSPFGRVQPMMALDGVTEVQAPGSAYVDSVVAYMFIAELMDQTSGEPASLKAVLGKFGLTSVSFNRLRSGDRLDIRNPFSATFDSALALFSSDLWFMSNDSGFDAAHFALLPVAPVAPTSPKSGYATLGGFIMTESPDSSGKLSIRTARISSPAAGAKQYRCDVVLCPTLGFSAQILYDRSVTQNSALLAKLVTQSLSVQSVAQATSLVLVAPAPYPSALSHAMASTKLMRESSHTAHNPTMEGLMDKLWYDIMAPERVLSIMFGEIGMFRNQHYYVVLRDGSSEEKYMPLVLKEGQRIAPSGHTRTVFVALDPVTGAQVGRLVVVPVVADGTYADKPVTLLNFAERMYGPIEVANHMAALFDPTHKLYSQLRQAHTEADVARKALAHHRFSTRLKSKKSDSDTSSDSDSGSDSSSSSSDDDTGSSHNSVAAAIMHSVTWVDALLGRFWNTDYYTLVGLPSYDHHHHDDVDHHWHTTFIYNGHYPDDASGAIMWNQ